MNKATFIEKAFANRFEYHLPGTYKGFLNNSVCDLRFDLDEPTQQTMSTFLKKNGVLWYASRENSLLYYAILKELSKNNTCYLIYFDSENAIQQLHPALHATKCEWRYSIEYIEGNEFCTQLGVQNPAEFLAAVNYSNRDLTNRYFYIAEIDENSLINYIHLYNSDVTNWSFAFCSAENKESLVQLFTDSTQRPSLANILAQVNSLVNIQIGSDEGYVDYILIQSENSINIPELENTINTSAAQYETLLQEVSPMDDDWKVDFYIERFTEIFKSAN